MPIEESTSLLSKLSLSSIINGTSKTLNVINQTIPVVKQMSPIMKNLKTMFNVMNEFKKSDTSNKEVIEEKEVKSITNNNGPTFFI
jgi:hypothetical protein